LVLDLCIIFSFPRGKNLNIVKGLMNPISIATYKPEVRKKKSLPFGASGFFLSSYGLGYSMLFIQRRPCYVIVFPNSNIP
jgi:hypothetical protein